MKTTLKAIIEARSALDHLTSLQLPAKVAFKASRLTKELTDNLQQYQNTHFALIKKYSAEEPDADGNFTVTAENVPAFQKELMELWSTEVELVCSYKLPSSQLEGLTVGDFMALDFIIEDA